MAHDIRIVTEADLRDAVGPDLATIGRIDRAIADIAAGAAPVLPPVLPLDLAAAGGEVDVKTAHVPGRDSFAIAADSNFSGNRSFGLPRHGGVMIQFSALTGQVEVVFLDNGYLSALGSAAAGAIAARHLAPGDVTTAGVIGTGLLARLHLRAAHLVRPFARALVWGRNPRLAADCAVELAETLGIEVEVTTDPRTVVKRSQLVVTATSARAPLIGPDWLHKELHLTAVGAQRPGRTEIFPAALARADLLVRDLAVRVETGAADLTGPVAAATLAEIVAGARPGRQGPGDITVFDLAGTGALDAAIAAHAVDRLGDAGTTIRA